MYRADKKRIVQLEETDSSLRAESSKLKEMADIAQNQTATLMMRHTSQEKELVALRRQLYELQMETDEKTIIGRGHA